MFRTQATTLDDRGQRIDLLKPAALARGNADLTFAPQLAKFLISVTRMEAQRFDWRTAPISVVGVIGLFFGAGLIGALARGAPRYIGGLFFWGGLFFLGFIVRAATRRTCARALASTAVSYGICGGCGYPLRGMHAEPDGCIICPECGAAWKAFRLSRAYWMSVEVSTLQSGWWRRFLKSANREQSLFGPDARGAYFRMLDKRLRSLPSDRRASLGPDRIRAIVRAQCRLGMVGRALVAMLPLGLGAIALHTVLDGDELVAIVLGSMSVLAAGISTAIIFGYGFATARRRGEIAAAFNVCNVCGCDLLVTGRRDDDACSTCITCGAAWRIAAPATALPMFSEAMPAAPSPRETAEKPRIIDGDSPRPVQE